MPLCRLRRDHYIETYCLNSILDQGQTELTSETWKLYQVSAIWQILFGYREWALKHIQMGFRQAIESSFRTAMNRYNITFDLLLRSWNTINGDISTQLLSRLIFKVITMISLMTMLL